MTTLKRIALTLVIVGAINWGLIGFFQFDLVATILGGQGATLSRIVYALVGLSGLYSLTILFDPMEDTDFMSDEESQSSRVNYATEFGEETDFLDEKEYDRDR